MTAAQISGCILASLFALGVVVFAVLLRRVHSRGVIVTRSRPGSIEAGNATEPRRVHHDVWCWRHLEDPGAVCMCKPWSREP